MAAEPTPKIREKLERCVAEHKNYNTMNEMCRGIGISFDRYILTQWVINFKKPDYTKRKRA